MTGLQGGKSGRLSRLSAAYVVARRDFMAILFSRSFLFFLLGPLFPIVVASFAGGVGAQLRDTVDRPQLGAAMTDKDVTAMLNARAELAKTLGDIVPKVVVLRRLAPGESYDPAQALAGGRRDIGAVLTGSLDRPVLTGTKERIEDWRGPVALIAASAVGGVARPLPEVTLQSMATSTASERTGQLLTAQAAQTLLFLLTMLLAGMVLSNLVEEKGNKVIEILAAAIPMDAVFLGKLFAMLAISFVGIAVWGSAAGVFVMSADSGLAAMAEPAVGWPAMIVLGVVYFAMAYLLLGSVFLALGSLATTVREVQTLSMPATMMQLLVFFLASFAMMQPGSAAETAAVVFPFSSPYAMVARAAQQPGLGQHLLAIGWQSLCVMAIVRAGSQLFRRRVMKSGPARGGGLRVFRRKRQTELPESAH
ncbi:ABC transporter permease [Novosphingobium sp. M1R2S20]|uniref:ABC transporter permease n=1 Tax=Novosphingobium rhizovicinum TaxID=3228928 RepID=A0ABV3R9D5_9SPHN